MNCWSEGLGGPVYMDKQTQKYLTKQLHEFSGKTEFEAMIGSQGTVLMEVACSPASILSAKIEDQ